ncbi:androgen-induced gene 1 protein-like [Eudromia elegans]
MRAHHHLPGPLPAEASEPHPSSPTAPRIKGPRKMAARRRGGPRPTDRGRGARRRSPGRRAPTVGRRRPLAGARAQAVTVGWGAAGRRAAMQPRDVRDGTGALRSPWPVVVLHMCCFVWALFSLCQNVGLPNSARRDSDDTYGGRWKYLTFINQILQTLLFGICVIIDFILIFTTAKKRSMSSRLLPVKDFIFSVLVFPVGLFVAVMFWTLYAYNRELIYPEELDEVNPSWLNHTMHTTILPLLFVELIACPHKYPGKLNGVIGVSIFGSSYLIWMLWVNYASGIWVYPILEALDIAGKMLLFVTSYLELLVFYFLGEKLTALLWGDIQKRKKQT